jgi:transcriptional regulator with XRE-family HTH domain
MAVSDRLKTAREKKGLTQREVARAIGVSQPAYCNFESGYKVPSLVIAKSISNVLGVSIDYLAEND